MSIQTASKPKAVAAAPNGVGANELAVVAQCQNMPKASEKPSIIEQAKTLARVLDDPQLQPMHPQTSRQLAALLTSLDGPVKKSRGRLAQVIAMTNPERQQAQ